VQYSINRDKVIFEKFDSEIILINLDNGNYFSIQHVALNIWELLEKGLDRLSVISTIAKIYKTTFEKIENDISEFLEELLKESLIVNTESTKNVFNSNVNDENIGKQIEPYSKPVLEIYKDMQNLILLDPIHEVDDTGWPNIDDKSKKVKK
jgi:hypothetical protein